VIKHNPIEWTGNIQVHHCPVDPKEVVSVPSEWMTTGAELGECWFEEKWYATRDMWLSTKNA
jgi:hypothetical protein